MKKYLVIGLESSATRLVSKIIALNLGMINNIDEWDGVDKIKSENFLVEHRSLPYGHRDTKFYYINESYVKNFDVIVITTRDINCIIKSKLENHQPNLDKCLYENKKSIKILKKIINLNDNVYLFSIESAVILKDVYIKKFLSDLGITLIKSVKINNLNERYIKLND